MLNKKIKNRYEIIKYLNRGAFGETYLAKDLDYPKHPLRVVKLLRPFNNKPQTIQLAQDLFQKEAEILSKLGKHDLIPELFAYFEEDQEFFLVQEYIEGADLTQEIYNGKKLNETDIIQLLIAILIPLEYLHQNNIIHRDLKPSNLMRRYEDNKIIIIDFGGIKQIATTGQNQPTIAIGTPGYYPIEQNQGFPTLASDIYAVGIIAIQALTGKFPISQDWEKEININSNLLKILKKMIASEAKNRYQSATKVLTILNQNYGKTITSSTRKLSTILTQTSSQILSHKIIKISLALIIFIIIFSVSFNFNIFNNKSSENDDKSPPPGWTW